MVMNCLLFWADVPDPVSRNDLLVRKPRSVATRFTCVDWVSPDSSSSWPGVETLSYSIARGVV